MGNYSSFDDFLNIFKLNGKTYILILSKKFKNHKYFYINHQRIYIQCFQPKFLTNGMQIVIFNLYLTLMLQHHIVHLNMTKVEINIISKLNFVIQTCIAKQKTPIIV